MICPTKRKQDGDDDSGEKMRSTQTSLQTKIDLEILKMKADGHEGEDLKIFIALKESIRARYMNMN